MFKKILLTFLFFFCKANANGIDYSYDAIGRLTQVRYDPQSSISYSYDDAGNIAC